MPVVLSPWNLQHSSGTLLLYAFFFVIFSMCLSFFFLKKSLFHQTLKDSKQFSQDKNVHSFFYNYIILPEFLKLQMHKRQL